MRPFGTSHWELLERRSETLFLVAGGLLVGYTTLNGLTAFTDVASPMVEDVLGPVAFAVGFLGLLGIYRALFDRTPRLARAGAVFAVLGGVGFGAIALQSLGQLTGLVSAHPPAWFPVVLLLGATGTILGFPLCGVAVLRTGVHSRTVGTLLMAPTVIFALMLSQAALFAQFGLFSESTMQLSAFLISSGQAVAYLSVGYALSLSSVRTDCTVAGSDVTTG